MYNVGWSLVFWSLNLAPELHCAVSDVDAYLLESGSWSLQDACLVRCPPLDPLSLLEVSAHVEVVVVNPRSPAGGGLAGLIGPHALHGLQEIANDKPFDVSCLAEWMGLRGEEASASSSTT